MKKKVEDNQNGERAWKEIIEKYQSEKRKKNYENSKIEEI